MQVEKRKGISKVEVIKGDEKEGEWMSRLRQIKGVWVCDDVSFTDGKHCDRGWRWHCPHLDADKRTCNFERTGQTLKAVCLYCHKPIEGTPYEHDFWVFGPTNFCNEEHFDAEVAETGEALERKEYESEEE